MPSHHPTTWPYLLVAASLATAVPACGLDSAAGEPSDTVEVPPTAPPTVRGEKETFEIATWNLEHFPKAGDESETRIMDIAARLRLDVIAVQELADTHAFHDMVDRMPGWESVAAGRYDPSLAMGRYNPPVGLLYDTRSVTVRHKYTIFGGESKPFPRSPLVAELEWFGVPITVIVVHLKAMGDNVISSDPNDEEARRKLACDLLAQYIDDNLLGQRVIVLGDFNDRLGEPQESNVFWAFESRPERFQFADMQLATQGGHKDMSYPPYGSHIDHILMTSELFPAFAAPGAEVQTLTVEGFLEYGWFEYSALVSDHRPVYMRLVFDSLQQPASQRPEP